LALEAETAITHLPSTERDVYRKLVAERIDKLQQQNHPNKTHPENKLIKSIRTKLIENNATITRADKGNSLVILPTPQYESKIVKFLSDNSFRTIAPDPSNSFQTQVRNTVNQSMTLIPKDRRWKYINLNPSTKDSYSQTRPTDQTGCKLAQCPSLPTIQTFYQQDQPPDTPTPCLQLKEYP
jgi:hypothetical protein